MVNSPMVKIGDVCQIEKGQTGIQSAVPGKYPLVTTAQERKSADSYQFDTAAVCIPLVSSTGHGKKSLNYVHYQEGKFALGTILAAVIPNDPQKLNAAFLHQYLQFYKDTKIVPWMKGAANVSLAIRDIAKIEIPRLPIDEQNEFIEIFNRATVFSELLAQEFDTQLAYVSKLRQAILQEAIEGKLTTHWRAQHPVQIGDPEFDASALFNHIQVEKKKLIAEKKVKKSKPFSPITEEDTLFDLPEGWIWCRLGEICSKIGSGSTPKGSNYSDTGIPFFRSQNIHDDGLRYDDIKFISDAVHVRMKNTIAYSHDLLLNITGGSLGRCALIPSEFSEGNVSQHVCIVRGIAISPEFLHKLVLSPVFQKMIFDSTTGAGREGLPKYNLEQFSIPLPPLAEQRSIVEKVERLLTIVDDLALQVSDRIFQTDALMQAVLREAFEE